MSKGRGRLLAFLRFLLPGHRGVLSLCSLHRISYFVICGRAAAVQAEDAVAALRGETFIAK